jgi:putative transposase
MNYSTSFRGRIKSAPKTGPLYFHCMSRVVAGEPLLRPAEQEAFRRLMRRQAAFCGVRVLTYAIMSNHFHLLVRVDPPRELSDAELIQRVEAFYGSDKARLVKRWLACEIEGPRIRKRLHKRMNDISFFLKELKQRFTMGYNHKHERFGTLWAEKFKSVLVEGDAEILLRVAGYIDLNPLRAGLCKDPKEYRFCGYAEAVAGGAEAREGLLGIYSLTDWRKAQSLYRRLLFGKGYHADLTKGRVSEAALRKVLRQKGELSAADAIRCRMRYFSEGLAIGTEEFILSVFENHRRRYWKKRKQAARSLRDEGWTDLWALNRMR